MTPTDPAGGQAGPRAGLRWLALILPLVLVIAAAITAAVKVGAGAVDAAGAARAAEAARVAEAARAAEAARLPPDVPLDASTAVVTVDAGSDLGSLVNPADFHNQAGPSHLLGPMDLRMIDQLRPAVTRVFVNPAAYWDPDTGSYDFDAATPSGNTMTAYLDQAAANAQQLMMNIGQCPLGYHTLARMDECVTVIAAGLAHYKRTYPILSYVEVFNEPDADAMRPLSVGDYYRWYRAVATAVARINAGRPAGGPIKVGGPATATFDADYLSGFLDRYAADPDTGKRLDFLTYHQYKRRADPAAVATERPEITDWLIERGLDPRLPVVVSEYGVFPGDQGTDDPAADALTQAAAMATLGGYYAASGVQMPMHWVFNHSSNDRKSMFVDGQDGVVNPYYHVVQMQRRLAGRRIDAYSSELSPAGRGINVLATRDDGRVAVMVTNYQWTDGTATHRVRLRLIGLPPAAASWTVRRQLVDAVTSNRHHDPGNPPLTPMNLDPSVDTDATMTVDLTLRPNAVTLITLDPS